MRLQKVRNLERDPSQRPLQPQQLRRREASQHRLVNLLDLLHPGEAH